METSLNHCLTPSRGSLLLPIETPANKKKHQFTLWYYFASVYSKRVTFCFVSIRACTYECTIYLGTYGSAAIAIGCRPPMSLVVS